MQSFEVSLGYSVPPKSESLEYLEQVFNRLVAIFVKR